MSSIEDTEKIKVISQLFEKECSNDDLIHYDTYFKLYNDEINSLETIKNPSKRIRDAVAALRSNPNNSKEDLGKILPRNGLTDEHIDKIMCCAVRVWLMIDCRLGDTRDGTTQYWNKDERLFELVNRAFRIPPKERSKVGLDKEDKDDMRKEALEATSKLTYRLTGMNLERYANIKTVPTDCLDQHLFFGQSYFHLFRQRRWLLDTIAIWDSFIAAQETQDTRLTNETTDEGASTSKGAPESNGASKSGKTPAGNIASADADQSTRPFPIPRRILYAALCSNDYLFPPDDSRAISFLKDKKEIENWRFKEDDTDTGMRSRQHNIRQIEHYQYHDGLVDLAHEFNSPPKGIKTIWKDTRNPIQFFTFWFGLFIAFSSFSFGAVQLGLASTRFARGT